MEFADYSGRVENSAPKMRGMIVRIHLNGDEVKGPMPTCRTLERLQTRSIGRGCTAINIVAIAILVSGHAGAQGPDANEFQPYPLRHAQASEVRAALAPLMPDGAEVAVDRRANRVLVRGSASAQDVAQRVVKSLDQPEATSGRRAAPSQPVLRTFDCRPGSAGSVAARLHDEFSQSPEVRIVADDRTGKVLAMAPPELQDRIAARAQGLGASPAAAIPSAAAQRQPSPSWPQSADSLQQGRPLEVALRSLSGERLETTLLNTLGSQLTPVRGSSPEMGTYRIALRNGSVEIAVDRRTNRVAIAGPADAAERMHQLIRAVDNSTTGSGESTGLVALRTSRPADIERTVEAIRLAGSTRAHSASRSDALDEQRVPLAGRLFQPEKKVVAEFAAADATALAQAPGPVDQPKGPAGKPGVDEAAGLVGPVQIELLEGLDVLVIRGNKRDVQQVVDIINKIEELSKATEPRIEIYPLQHADSNAIGTVINQLYSQVYAARQGTVFLLPLVKPNSLLIVGREESVQRMIDLVKRFDVPVPPESQFEVFRLRHSSAAAAQTVLSGVYGLDQGGMSARVRVTVDVRANSLIVQAAPRDLAEVRALLTKVDTPTSDTVNELRMFKLTNTLATDVATVLQGAIQSQGAGAQVRAVTPGAAMPTTTPGAPVTPTGAAPGATSAAAAGQRSSMLQFVTVDTQGRRLLTSGILSDVTITPDVAANTLLVSAPAESMDLIDALVRQLDQPPAMRAEIKVFHVFNGDASQIAYLLDQLFAQAAGPTTNQAGMAGMMTTRTAAGEGEASLVPIRFAVDPRTNSLIATGTPADLIVVEAIILRLDSAEAKTRKAVIYRLKNVPANDVANSLSTLLQNETMLERSIAPQAQQLVSPYEMIERQVLVVPEPVTNSLIISATPRYYERTISLVEELDRRKPMVLIQVLIAEVELQKDEEFGVELGLQDSLLFSRGMSSPGSLTTPGFLIKTPAAPTTAPTTQMQSTAGQSLTEFGLGRGGAVGFGGLVLSASSESVSILLRAMQQDRRLDVLSRPQIMTLDNQEAYVQVGQSVPQVSGVTLTTVGQTNNVQYQDVGVILRVVPRISPDGLVVMLIDAERSDVGAEADGIPISTSATGQVIRAPRINRTLAQTTVSAGSGQTVILGGLMNRNKSRVSRRVPYLSDVPVLGNLFRFDSSEVLKRELLIVMTPHVIEKADDMERIKQVEAARMQWCFADIIEMHGDGGLRGRSADWSNSETTVIYPDAKPSEAPKPPALTAPEVVPSPNGAPLPPPVPGPGTMPAAQPPATPGTPNPLRGN